MENRTLVLVSMMLLLPILDRAWATDYRLLTHPHRELRLNAIPVGIITALFTFDLASLTDIFNIVFYSAIPEEWFFRAYLLHQLMRLATPLRAILLSSLLFAILHVPTQGLEGLLVFMPSIVLGYIYLLYRSVLFNVSTHSLFNVIHISLIA